MEQDQSNNKNVSLSLIAEYGASESESDTETRSNDNTNDDSDAPELSEMVLKNNIINACAHGPVSRPVEEEDDVYELPSSGHMIIDSHSGDVGYEVAGYREDNSDSDTSSSSDSDSEVDSVKDIEEVSSGEEGSGNNKAAKFEAPKVSGEIGIEDLPPIEDLAISLPAQETTKLGTVYSIVEQLVIVKANPGSAPVDLDSVLFLENGAKALGKVYDVFGPVTEPHYAVRFNSHQHVVDRGVVVGMDVFIAPRSDHTNYVFLPDLMKMKGSDASWKDDIEPPPSQVEYSDDEEERRAKREAKQKHRTENEDGENSKNTRKMPEKRNQRPSESSSRFGSGPSRGRNPFSAGSRRNNPNTFQRFARPFMDARTPPPHPNDPSNQFGMPPNFPPMFPAPFNPNTPPPPFMYQYPRMRGPIPPMGPPPMRPSGPIFGTNFCSMPGPQPQWVNTEPPPPPGT